ncbi:MAG TPA: DUF2330 domain-containing protein [Actinomycetes bacterium]|jgi:hypothetical protein|nr:DUF2330 domain-containing protein [Actinomycetes bacterium]
MARATRLGVTGLLALVIALVSGAAPALACGGLVGPGGTVQLSRTTTLAAYRAGVEHYVTAFEYRGGGAKFGSIVPLPGVPTKVEKGGDWTLQRLVRETQPVTQERAAFAATSARTGDAEVLLRAKVDALDITVLRGGGMAVGAWAREHGFGLSPDAPEVLDFYAARSPVFLAASFDGTQAQARGQRLGDGTPVHVTIPTTNPWVPLRILGLGLRPSSPVQADVYLLTDRKPAILPEPAGGVRLEQSRQASTTLLADLRSDRGMDWLPRSGVWLSYLKVDTTAGALKHDLAVDASGQGTPSLVAAGLPVGTARGVPSQLAGGGLWWLLWPALLAMTGVALVAFRAGRLGRR